MDSSFDYAYIDSKCVSDCAVSPCQMEDEWHAELQPRADHAECCDTPAQPRRQHHEGETHILRSVINQI